MSGYSTGILGCLDDKPSLVDSLCCYPCQIGYQFGALNGNGEQLSMLHCLLSAIGAFQCCICMIRRNIDEKYNVGEGCCVSLCMAYFVPWCSLCQTHRELKARRVPPSGICVKIMGGAAGMIGGDGTMPTQMKPGMECKSKNGRFNLAHQTDGNVVVYDGSSPIWATNTCGRATEVFEMQGDGNLVLYAPGRQPIWASNTCGSGGTNAIMQDDGNFVVYNASHSPVWATNTVRA